MGLLALLLSISIGAVSAASPLAARDAAALPTLSHALPAESAAATLIPAVPAAAPNVSGKYFGARYYGSRIARFTTTDPAYTIAENAVDPQRWNRYAYARNNPLKFVDPDGRAVRYANSSLQTLFGFLAGRSGMVRDTLAQYTGPGKPDLFITQGDAGRDPISGEKNTGLFSAKVDVTYDDAATSKMKSDMTAEQIQDLGTWAQVGESTLTLDSSLTVNVQNKQAIGVAAHELGHADHAARSPLDYRRKSEQIRDAKGKGIPHDDRPAEKVANEYRDKALKEVRP